MQNWDAANTDKNTHTYSTNVCFQQTKNYIAEQQEGKSPIFPDNNAKCNSRAPKRRADGTRLTVKQKCYKWNRRCRVSVCSANGRETKAGEFFRRDCGKATYCRDVFATMNFRSRPKPEVTKIQRWKCLKLSIADTVRLGKLFYVQVHARLRNKIRHT